MVSYNHIRSSELTEIANKILRDNGCNLDGRPKMSVKSEQRRFERRQIKCPFSGKSRPGRG